MSIALNEENEDHILAATAWALGQIGRHTPEHAKAVALANVLPKLLQIYMRQEASEDLQTKAKKALKNLLQKCVYLPVLEPLLHEAPPNILKHVVAQFSKVLPHDPKARRLFVTSGGLKKIQEIKTEEGSPLAEHINTINSCFPEEVVKSDFTSSSSSSFLDNWVFFFLYLDIIHLDMLMNYLNVLSNMEINKTNKLFSLLRLFFLLFQFNEDFA